MIQLPMARGIARRELLWVDAGALELDGVFILDRSKVEYGGAPQPDGVVLRNQEDDTIIKSDVFLP